METEGGILLEDSHGISVKGLTQKRCCPKDSYCYLNVSAVWNRGISLIYKDLGIQNSN